MFAIAFISKLMTHLKSMNMPIAVEIANQYGLRWLHEVANQYQINTVLYYSPVLYPSKRLVEEQ